MNKINVDVLPNGQRMTPNGQIEPVETDIDAIAIEKSARALLRKISGKCTSGIDKINPGDLYRVYRDDEQAQIKLAEEINSATYEPEPYVYIEIPKGNGKTRKICIPTATDRLVQNTLCEYLHKVLDQRFHPLSVGYRKGKSTYMAAKLASGYASQYKYIVRLDFKSCFDRINIEKLVHRLKQHEIKPEYLKVIIKCLYAPAKRRNGEDVYSSVGIKQGGPLSPLLANLYLNELDWHLERKNIPFVRYADDLMIFARTMEESFFLIDGVGHYCEKKLKTPLNFEKTTINHGSSSYLGYVVGPSRVDVAAATVNLWCDELRNGTSNDPALFFSDFLLAEKLKSRFLGFAGYYSKTDNYAIEALPKLLKTLDDVESEYIRNVQAYGKEELKVALLFCLEKSFSEIRDRLKCPF